MQAALIKSIHAEIKQIEAEIEAEKQLLKAPEKIDLWKVEKQMRALRIRREELERNLSACCKRNDGRTKSNATLTIS